MELAFSKGLYEKSALLKAAYSFTEVAYCLLYTSPSPRDTR